jgi:hypothetical protein
MRILALLGANVRWCIRCVGPIVGAALLIFPILAADSTQVLLLSGKIVNPSGQPLPGCLLSVVSSFGRSAPTFSQGDGSFQLEVALPPGSSPAASSTPFLEVYWNKELMYRQPVTSLTIESALPKFQTVSGPTDWTKLLHGGGRVEVQPIRLGRAGSQ